MFAKPCSNMKKNIHSIPSFIQYFLYFYEHRQRMVILKKAFIILNILFNLIYQKTISTPNIICYAMIEKHT